MIIIYKNYLWLSFSYYEDFDFLWKYVAYKEAYCEWSISLYVCFEDSKVIWNL